MDIGNFIEGVREYYDRMTRNVRRIFPEGPEQRRPRFPIRGEDSEYIDYVVDQLQNPNVNHFKAIRLWNELTDYQKDRIDFRILLQLKKVHQERQIPQARQQQRSGFLDDDFKKRYEEAINKIKETDYVTRHASLTGATKESDKEKTKDFEQMLDQLEGTGFYPGLYVPLVGDTKQVPVAPQGEKYLAHNRREIYTRAPLSGSIINRYDPELPRKGTKEAAELGQQLFDYSAEWGPAEAE
jgi:hypothetical protein